jgi:hypothetical protein
MTLPGTIIVGGPQGGARIARELRVNIPAPGCGRLVFTSQIILARRDGARHGLAPTSVLGMGPLAPGGGT